MNLPSLETRRRSFDECGCGDARKGGGTSSSKKSRRGRVEEKMTSCRRLERVEERLRGSAPNSRDHNLRLSEVALLPSKTSSKEGAEQEGRLMQGVSLTSSWL